MCGFADVPRLHFTVFCFGGRGKETAWHTRTTYGDVTPAFSALGAMTDPRAIDEWMQPLE